MQMGLNRFQVIHICFETLEASEAAPHPVSCLDRTWIVPISGYALNSTTSDCSENSQAVPERKQPPQSQGEHPSASLLCVQISLVEPP